MPTADEHLERALREYNDKVNALEDGGSPKELLDAYINRGTVLSMMGSAVSAATDFDEALSIIRTLEKEGRKIDPGYAVKAHVSRGELEIGKSARSMAEDYRAASGYLGELRDGCKYYSAADIVEMCLDCGCDLVDADMAGDAPPFIDKALSLLVGKDDDRSRNRYMEVCDLEGQVLMDSEEFGDAAKSFDECIRTGEELRSRDALEDIMELVSAYVSRGDLAEDGDEDDLYFSLRDRAIAIMEELLERDDLDDVELLGNLHGEVAQAYIKRNDMRSAEKHLLRQVAINLRGAKDYMDSGIGGVRGTERDGDDE